MKQSRFFKQHNNLNSGNYSAANRYIKLGWDTESLAKDCSDNEQKIKHYTEAIGYYTQAIELCSKHKGAFKNRGGARERLARLLPDDGQKLALYDEAIKDYTNAIQLNANDPQIFADRGYAKGEQGRISSQAHYYEEAIADFDKSISLLETSNESTQKLCRAYQNRAWNKGQLGELNKQPHYHQSATSDCDQAISMDESNARAYHIRAWNKEQIGIEAVDDYNKAAELNPEKYGSTANRLSC